MNYDDHQWMMDRLREAQKADHDMREQAREAHAFVTARHGQWEQRWWDIADGRPRYTFDQVTPVIDQIVGPIERSDFSIDVAPAGGDASQDIAEIYAGLIRNIENISRAKSIVNRAARKMVTGGIDGWRIRTKYIEGDSFDQDIVWEKIANFVDRVWFGPHEEPDASDAEYCFVLTAMDPETFKQKYPDADNASITTDKQANIFFHREDLVMCGEFLYLQPEPRTLVLCSNGKVYNADEFAQVEDELLQLGVTVVRKRTRNAMKVMSRKFSASGWLEEPRQTVFENWIPVVPVYGNFEVTDDKRVFQGAVEKLMDPARVYNYAQSRQIEEGALAPRAKWLLTPEQLEGHEADWANMNVSAEPYELYNHVDGHAPPDLRGGAMINPGLRAVTEDMRQIMMGVSGQFAAAMGDNPLAQSGVAIDKLQDRSDTTSNKYMDALQHSMTHTARIIVDAIPRVYDSGRQVRILDEDGSRDFITLGATVIDEQTGQPVTLYDLSSGAYDVTCVIAPNYRNRQNETVRAITEIGKVDPTMVEIGADILARSVTSPGMDDLADRKRRQLFQAGLIPFDQMTDEEKQEAQAAAQQPPQPDPNMVLAQAEVEKAKADQMEVQRKVMEQQQAHQAKLRELELREFELQIRYAEAQVAAQEAGVSIQLKGAQAAKAFAEAEAQDIENDAVVTGIRNMMGGASAA